LPSRLQRAKTRLLQCQAGNSTEVRVENGSAGQQKIRLVYLVGPPLSMTHYDRRSPTKDASSERDKDSSSLSDWQMISCGSFHSLGNIVAFQIWLLPRLGNLAACLAMALPSRQGCQICLLPNPGRKPVACEGMRREF